MDISNWINLGILVLTALLGLLAWLGARMSAREAKASQEEASRAASRSASAAEDLAKHHGRLVDIESQRAADAMISAQRASLYATMVNEQATRNGGARTEQYLRIANESALATALRVRILADGKSIKDYPECRTDFPLEPSIGPRGELKLLLKSVGGGGLGRSFGLQLTWDDESGVGHEWRGQISW